MDGINELAAVLEERMTEKSKKDPVVDFGTIGKNGYLVTDSFQTTLSRDDYMVCEHVGDLAEGDRVAVIWIYPEPVIVGKIKK